MYNAVANNEEMYNLLIKVAPLEGLDSVVRALANPQAALMCAMWFACHAPNIQKFSSECGREQYTYAYSDLDH